MKKIVTVLLSLLTTQVGFSQMLEAGDAVLELGMGFPNIEPITSTGISFHGGFASSDGESRNFGQIMVKAEYMIADNMGVATSFNYGYFYNYDVASYSEFNSEINDWVDKSYYYETRVHKIRFTAGINYHVLQTNKVDSWVGAQAGTRKAFGTMETNDPDNPHFDVFAIPFALRVHYGIRVFFKEYLAGYMELGIGGPVINAGLTYKF